MNNPHTRELQETLVRLSNYAFAVETFLDQEADKLAAEIEEGAKRFPEAERGDYYEARALDVVEIANEMPSLLRHSVLGAADSAIERYLVDTCTTYAGLNGLPWPPQARWRYPLRDSQTYLKSTAQIAFPDQVPAWTAVLRLRELRNTIVHADADLSTSKAELRSWLERQKHLSVHQWTVSIRSSFIDDALAWYAQFMEALDAACAPLGLWASVFPPEPDKLSGAG